MDSRRGEGGPVPRAAAVHVQPGRRDEREEYTFDLEAVAALELEIVPDIGRGAAVASLVSLRVA